MIIKIRPSRPDDINMVLSSWAKSYLYLGNWIYKPSEGLYLKGKDRLIKKLLETSTILVATTEEDESQILGYIVLDPETVHYCFVKEPFRKFGVGKELMKNATSQSFYSHHTSYTKFIKSDLRYDPTKG